jgi:hypothetical protein
MNRYRVTAYIDTTYETVVEAATPEVAAAIVGGILQEESNLEQIAGFRNSKIRDIEMELFEDV